MFSKGPKVTMSNLNVKIFPTRVFNNFNLWGVTKCHSVWSLSFWLKFLKFILIWVFDCFFKLLTFLQAHTHSFMHSFVVFMCLGQMWLVWGSVLLLVRVFFRTTAY